MLPSKSDKSEIPPRLRKGRARRVDCRDVFSREHETTASFSLQDQFPLRDQLLGGARKSTQHIRQHGAPLPLVWVVVLDNAVPPYAVPFSEADNGPQFIARAVLEGYYHLGRAGTGLPHGALITYGTRQLTVQRYEVLCFATAMRWGIAETQREALQQSSVIVSSCIHSFDASGTRSDSSSLLDSDIFRIIPDDGMPDIPFSESNLSSSLNKFKFASPLDRRAVEEKYVPAAFEVVTAPTAATVMGSPVVPAMDDDVAGESLSGRCTLSVLQGGSSSRTGGHSSVDDSWQSNLPVSLGTSSAVARMEPRKTDQKLRRLSLTTQSHSCPRAGTTFKEAPSIVEGGVAMHNHSHRRTRSLSAVSHVHPASSPPAETTSGPQKNVNRPRDPSPASSPRTIGYLSPIDHLLLLPSTMPEPSSHSTDSVSTTGPPAQRPLSAERIVRREHWGDVQPNSANRAKLSSAVRVSSPLASSSHLSAVSSPGAGKHRSSVDVREEDTVLDAAEFLDTVRPSLHAVVEESHRSSTIIGTQRQPHNRHRQEAVSLRSLVPSPVTPGTVVDGKRLQLARDTPPIVSGDVDIAHSSSVVKTFEQPSRSTTRIPSPETERARLPREEVESSTRSKVVTRYRIERNSDQVTQELAYPSSAEDKGNSHDTQQGVGAPHVVSVNPVKTPPSWSPPFSLSHGQTVTSTEHVMSDRDVHTTTLAVGGASVAQRLGGNKPQDQSRVQRKRERAMDTDWHRSMEITMTTLGRAPARIKDEVQAPLSLPISPLVVPRGVGSPSTTLIEPQDFHPSRERPVKLDADHHRSQISSNPTLSSERKSSSSVGPLSSSADGAVHVTTDISLAEEFAVVAASLLVAVSVGGGSAAAQGSDHMHSTDVTILGQAIEDSDSRQTHTLPLIASVSPRTQTIELVSTDIQCAPPHEVKTQLGFVEEESRASEQRGHVRPPSPMGPRPPVLKSRAVHFVVGSDNAGGSGQGYVSLTQSHVHEIEKTISESSRAELVQVQQLISQGDVVDNTGTAPQPAHLLLSNPVTVPTQRSYSLDARPQAVGAMAMHQSVDNNNQLDMSVVATDPSKSSAGSCASSDKVQEKLRPRIKRKPVPPIHSELSRTEHSTESSEEDSFKFVQDIGASPTASTQCHASVGGAGCSEDLRQLESDQSRDHWNSFLDVTSHAAASRTQRKYQVPISKYLLPESDVDTGLVTSRKREGNDDRTASHKPCDPAIREDDVAGQEKDMEVAENSTGIVDSLSLESSLVATTALPTAYSTTTEQSCEFPAGTPHHVDDRDDEHDRTVHKSSVTDLDTATAQQSKPCTINTEEVAVYQFTPQQSVVVNLPEFPSFTTSSISSTRVSSDIGINMDVGRASASIQTPRIETTEDQPQTEHVVHTYGLLGACPRAPSDSFSSMAHLTSIFESEVLPNVCADQATESCLGPDRSNMVLSAVMQSHSGHIDALPSIQMRENQAKSERVQFAMGNEEIHDSNELMASKTFLDCDGKTLSNDDRDRFDSRPRKPVSVSSSRGPLQSSVRSERPSSEPDKETTSQRSRLEWTEMELDITTGSAPLAAPQQHITVVTTPLKNIVVLDSIQLCSHSEKTLAGLTPTANKTAGPTSTTDGGTPRGQATESAGGGLCMNTLTLRTQRLLSPPHPTPITPHDDETVHLQELSGNELQHELTISQLEPSSVLCLQGFTTQTTDSLSGSPAAKAERSFVEDDSEHVRIDEKSSPALSPLTRPAVSAQCETVVDCLSVYQSEESGHSSRRVLVPPQTAETDDGVHKVILSVDRSGFVAQKEVSVEIERASSPDYHCQEGSGNSSRSPISSVTDSYVGDDPLAKDPILPSVSARSQHGSPVTSTLPGLVDNHVQTTSALFNETSEDFVNEEKLDAERHGGAPFPPPPDHQDQPETANSPVSERPSPEVVLDQTTTEFQLRSGYVYVEHQGDLATRWVEPGSDEAAIMSRRDGAPVLPPEPEAEPSTSPAEPSSVTPSQACRDERDHPQKSAHLVSAQLDPSSEATPEYRTCGPSAGAAPLSQDSPSFFPDFASSGVSEVSEANLRVSMSISRSSIVQDRVSGVCEVDSPRARGRDLSNSCEEFSSETNSAKLVTDASKAELLSPSDCAYGALSALSSAPSGVSEVKIAHVNRHSDMSSFTNDEEPLQEISISGLSGTVTCVSGALLDTTEGISHAESENNFPAEQSSNFEAVLCTPATTCAGTPLGHNNRNHLGFCHDISLSTTSSILLSESTEYINSSKTRFSDPLCSTAERDLPSFTGDKAVVPTPTSLNNHSKGTDTSISATSKSQGHPKNDDRQCGYCPWDEDDCKQDGPITRSNAFRAEEVHIVRTSQQGFCYSTAVAREPCIHPTSVLYSQTHLAISVRSRPHLTVNLTILAQDSNDDLVERSGMGARFVFTRPEGVLIHASSDVRYNSGLGTGRRPLLSLHIDRRQSDDREISSDALRLLVAKIFGATVSGRALSTRHGLVDTVGSFRAWKALAPAILRQLPHIEALRFTWQNSQQWIAIPSIGQPALYESISNLAGEDVLFVEIFVIHGGSGQSTLRIEILPHAAGGSGIENPRCIQQPRSTQGNDLRMNHSRVNYVVRSSSNRGANSLRLENLSSDGSVYRACKGFICLALPQLHPYWTSDEEAYSGHLVGITWILEKPLHVLTSTGGHTFLLSSSQQCSYPIKQSTAKYGKFAYLSAFGHSVPVAVLTLEEQAIDFALALSDDDGDTWKVRRQTKEARIEGGRRLRLVWYPWSDVEVETCLVPASPSAPLWHLCVHCIHSSRKLRTAEGGWVVYGQRGGECALEPATSDSKYGTLKNGPEARAVSEASVSGIVDLSSPTSRTSQAMHTDANSNLVIPRAIMPMLHGKCDGSGKDDWLVSAVFGSLNAAGVDGLREGWQAKWLKKPEIAALVTR